jgi:hypothetical protein
MHLISICPIQQSRGHDFREDFKKFSVYFYSFAIVSPWRRAIPFISINLNSLPQRMICAKSGKNWPRGFEDFKNDPTPYLHFSNYLPFDEDLSLYMNKVELPSSKDNLYHV